MSQIAKMYLRGTLFTKKMKNLSEKQKQEIEDIVELVMVDPHLQQCRHEFCNALARTIRNEYDDRDVGLQDYRVAIMRAAVAAKHGKKPTEDALTNPIQRKKWFQTWAFNYLRQILRENKINSVRTAEKVSYSADTAALYHVTQALTEIIKKERDVPHRRLLRSLLQRSEVIELDIGYLLKFDHWSFPIAMISAVRKLNTTYLKLQVEITPIIEGILIKRLADKIPEVKITKRSDQFVKETSFDADVDQEDRRDQLETQIMDRQDATISAVEKEDLIASLMKKIPSETKTVLNIYLEDTRPEEYCERYGPGNPKIVHVAEFLGKSPKEIKHHLSILKHHCLCMGIGM